MRQRSSRPENETEDVLKEDSGGVMGCDTQNMPKSYTGRGIGKPPALPKECLAPAWPASRASIEPPHFSLANLDCHVPPNEEQKAHDAPTQSNGPSIMQVSYAATD